MAVSLIEKITAGIRTYFASDIAARQVAQAALTVISGVRFNHPKA